MIKVPTVGLRPALAAKIKPKKAPLKKLAKKKMKENTNATKHATETDKTEHDENVLAVADMDSNCKEDAEIKKIATQDDVEEFATNDK